MSGRLVVDAPAKVNLFLRVLHRRPDGFHELETLFQAISLADVVEVALSERGRGGGGGGGGGGEDENHSGSEAPPVSLQVVGPDLGAPQDNLAYRAAARFLEETALPHAVRIRLTKRIPAGGGLGGGSSDAAAVLRSLAALTGREDPRLLGALALELGSDVPFFLGPGPLALGRGRGERLSPLSALPVGHLVLVLPPVRISTGDAYGDLAAKRLARPSGRERAGRRESSELRRTSEPLEASEMETSSLLSDPSWQRIGELAQNDFEEIVIARYPDVLTSLEGMRREGAAWTLLSGSGSASFGVFEDREQAARAAAKLTAELGWLCITARTLAEMPKVRPAARGG